jgi:hypothetical protein
MTDSTSRARTHAICRYCAVSCGVFMDIEDLRRGVVSMSHSYGIDIEQLDPESKDGAPQPYSMGGHTGALASADLDYIEPFSGIPRMSAISVYVSVALEGESSPEAVQ